MYGIVLAQATIDTVGPNGVATIKGLEGLFDNLLRVVVGFGGIVLFMMIIVAGYKLMTSGGDAKAAEAAKKTLTYAIAGMALVGLAYLLIVLISEITGNTNILNFIISP